ncbi:MAG: peptidase [Gemmatimonadetes bacterium]|nr:peptidase [Gemmatimonadota bacterium]
MHRTLRAAAIAALLCPLAAVAVRAQEKIDAATVAKIRDEGLNRSQVMDHMVWLTDVYGPRLTGSPTFQQAGDWAVKTLAGWGLTNPHFERWSFGQGWALEHFDAAMTEPQVQPLIALPKAWTPGTNGPVTAEVVMPSIASANDFAAYRGKLKGKIVLTQPARAVRMLDGRIVLRMTPNDVKEAMTPPPDTGVAGGRAGQGGRGAGGRGGAQAFAAQLQKFWKDEGVVALLDRGSDADSSAGGSELSWYTQRVDGGTIFVQSGGGSRDSSAVGLPQITLAVEHYNRMARILAKGVPVKMELNVRTRFYDETTPRGFNVIADIPGTDPALKDEVVLIGAHFDSWHGATGATDNAAGDAAMMEAMRILKTVGARPRRTIRIGLWGGEEEGELGSRAYVLEHLGDPATMQLKPDHAKFSAYYNIDNGTGKIRGVWMQGNAGVAPVFAALTAPVKDLGVDILSPRSVTSTDHLAFDAVGLPGFQFVQERYEYNSRTHHSNMDVVDRVQPADMKQMATVVATMAFLTAQRDAKLPRKPLPTPRPARPVTPAR